MMKTDNSDKRTKRFNRTAPSTVVRGARLLVAWFARLNDPGLRNAVRENPADANQSGCTLEL